MKLVRAILACFVALVAACLVASMLAFGSALPTPIVMLWVAFTALPLYALASLHRRPNWLVAMLIGAFCTCPLFIATRTDSQMLLLLRTLVLPGAIGGLVFHGVFAALTRGARSREELEGD